jgi:hypothetical protein
LKESDMIRMLPAALLLLAACQQRDEPHASNDTATQAAEASPPSEVPALEGDWRVTKIEGSDATGAGMTATFRDAQASLATGCLRRAWTYTQKRNVVRFKTNPSGSANCGRTPNANEESAYAALEGATIAIFAKEGNEASLSGGGGNLTLERR